MKNILCHLPCLSAEEQLKFYTSIGFDIIEINKYCKKPNKDIMVKYKKIYLQFYINEKLLINENISIKYISVDNVEQLYETFINNLKRNGLEIPRSGIPGITEIEGMEGKKQFSIADPSGNTFIIKTENNYEE
jgi:effector-binding domain-containing protein